MLTRSIVSYSTGGNIWVALSCFNGQLTDGGGNFQYPPKRNDGNLDPLCAAGASTADPMVIHLSVLPLSSSPLPLPSLSPPSPLPLPSLSPPSPLPLPSLSPPSPLPLPSLSPPSPLPLPSLSPPSPLPLSLSPYLLSGFYFNILLFRSGQSETMDV